MVRYGDRNDSDETVLQSMGSVSKAHPRVEIDGSVDELNSLVGTARPTGYDDIDDRLRTLQNHLHVVHADVTHPDPPDGHPTVRPSHVTTLESWIDSYDGACVGRRQVPLPEGGPGSVLCAARTVCQRAERTAVEVAAEERMNEQIIGYLNRLADVLFVFARVVNSRSRGRRPVSSNHDHREG